MKSKKNRIILHQKTTNIQNLSYRNILNGVIQQDQDNIENNSKNSVRFAAAGSKPKILPKKIKKNRVSIYDKYFS